MATMMFGDMHESLNAGKKPSEVNWISFKYGMLTGMLPWVIMVYEFITVPDAEDMIPWWAYLAVFEYFVLFNTFPLTQWL